MRRPLLDRSAVANLARLPGTRKTTRFGLGGRARADTLLAPIRPRPAPASPARDPCMETLRQFVDVFLHLDRHLNDWAESLGPWLYVVLFLIVFCETALVITPFLPGDSLLFAVGALAASEGSPI